MEREKEGSWGPESQVSNARGEASLRAGAGGLLGVMVVGQEAQEPPFTGGARGPRVATLTHGTSFPSGTLQGKSVSASKHIPGTCKKVTFSASV